MGRCRCSTRRRGVPNGEEQLLRLSYPNFSPYSLQTIKDAIGPLPLFHEKAGGGEEEENDENNGELANGGASAALPASHRPAVLADGSYATQVRRI